MAIRKATQVWLYVQQSILAETRHGKKMRTFLAARDWSSILSYNQNVYDMSYK